MDEDGYAKMPAPPWADREYDVLGDITRMAEVAALAPWRYEPVIAPRWLINRLARRSAAR